MGLNIGQQKLKKRNAQSLETCKTDAYNESPRRTGEEDKRTK